MKKVLFTCMLLFTFIAARASEVVSNEHPKETSKVSAKNNAFTIKEVNSKPLALRSATTAVMPCCYALSCGVACYSSAVCARFEEYDIAAVFGFLEMQFCDC